METNEKVKQLCSTRHWKMASELADCDGIRIWHDQALVKRPWANPTSWHLIRHSGRFQIAGPYHLVALDDATLKRCLYLSPIIPHYGFENPE